ncbi:hypothetical protein [Cryptosporangium minutisporangium]|uniref:hypothetical protein n=1 Tax=Cryptosporangium minutisporangium TaxID=113569 RepID=UPI0031EE84C2
MTDTVCDSPDPLIPLLVPAGGQVFDFCLFVYLRWSSPTHTYGQLQSFGHQHAATARSTVRRSAWEIGRRHEPTSIADVEREINRCFAGGLCYEDDRYGTVRCEPTVRVLMDQRLRQHLEPLGLSRAEEEERHRGEMARAALAEERTRFWLDTLRTFEGAPPLAEETDADPVRRAELERKRARAEMRRRRFLLPFAAQLADERLAQVADALSQFRWQRGADLVTVLGSARDDHRRVGLYEFAQAYDRAIELFCEELGLSVDDVSVPVQLDAAADG